MRLSPTVAAPHLGEIADTAMDMSPIRHAFQAGIPAQRGIEH